MLFPYAAKLLNKCGVMYFAILNLILRTSCRFVNNLPSLYEEGIYLLHSTQL